MNDQAIIDNSPERRIGNFFGATMYYLGQFTQAHEKGDSAFLDVWLEGARRELETAFNNLHETERAGIMQFLSQLTAPENLTPPESGTVQRND